MLHGTIPLKGKMDTGRESQILQTQHKYIGIHVMVTKLLQI